MLVSCNCSIKDFEGYLFLQLALQPYLVNINIFNCQLIAQAYDGKKEYCSKYFA